MRTYTATLTAAALTLLAGCSSDKPEPPKPDTVINIPLEVPGTLLPEEGKSRLRYDENLKKYYTGRYIDPNNPDVMYEANTIYRVEQPAGWIKTPRPVAGVPEGVAMKVGVDKRTMALIAEFEQDMQVLSLAIRKIEEQKRESQKATAELKVAAAKLDEIKREIEKERQSNMNFHKRCDELDAKLAQLEYRLVFQQKQGDQQEQPKEGEKKETDAKNLFK